MIDAKDTSGASDGSKTRLAVLGGGPASLTALYHITSKPDIAANYDITLYQMGWRLGGKGASGRAEYGRIEEHGLHVLFGFYDNFFSMIQTCYKELGRPANHPLATWTDAFKPHNFGVVEEYFKDEWHPWPLEFPSNDSVPGSSSAIDTPTDYVMMAAEALIEALFGWRALNKLQGGLDLFNAHGHNPHTKHWTDPFFGVLLWIIGWLVKAAVGGIRKLESGNEKDAHHDRLHRRLSWIQKWLWPIIRRWSQRSLAAHKFWLLCDFLIAVIRGVIGDRVYDKGGFNRIDEYDFREWLELHGIHKITLSSPYCRVIYDAAFSYENGDPNKQRIAAGAAMRALFRMGFTFKGSVYYKMQAGMGDTVFTPIYEVLKKRGVKFRFFHKVESLHLSVPQQDQARSVSSVTVTRQATLKNSNPESYVPLVNVQNLECWPASPLYDQLNNADELRNYDLESYYCKLPDNIATTIELKAGEDYDHVLFGIPVGAVPYVCEELVNDKQNPRWKTMVAHVRSVTTATFQLWFNKNLQALGWKMPSPLLSLYVEPLNTWADMSQVIVREDWPAGEGPKNISYYCGPQPGPTWAPDPGDSANANFEKDQYADARKLAVEFCQNSLTTLLPGAAVDDSKKFDWQVLLDPKGGEGAARFESQYWRSNCGPSERCTLAMPGATQHRIKANESGYANMSITGDWINNGLYVACMEGAITSGIYGARAVTGYQFQIIGEDIDAM